MGQFAAAQQRSLAPALAATREDVGPSAARSADATDPASKGLLAGLQSIGRAAALLDGNGGLVGNNALARPFVDLLVGVGLGRRCAPSRSIHRRLRDVLDAAHRRDAREPGSVGVFVLPDGEMLIVRAAPIGAGEPGLFRRAAVLVQFARRGFDLVPDPASLRGAFGLTATESEVALALVGGASTSAIARDRAVSLATIRSHLKTIFAKTGTRRQAHLVALILQVGDIAPPA